MNLELSGFFSGISKKKLEKKIAQYKNLLIKDPYDPKICLQLGDLLAKLGQREVAKEYYQAAASLLSQNYNPSKVNIQLIEVYKKILNLSPDDQICENLCEEYSRMGNHMKAYDTYLSVGEKLYKQGAYEKALKLYKSALIPVSNSFVAHARCAEIYEQLEQFEKSALEYAKLAELSSTRGKYVEALDYCTKALELAPSNPGVRSKVAETYQKAGKTEEALSQYLNLAQDYLESGEASTALRYYESCLAINPDLPEAIQGKAKAVELHNQNLITEELGFRPSIFQEATPLQDLEPSSATGSRRASKEVKKKARQIEDLKQSRVSSTPTKVGEISSEIADNSEGSNKIQALIREKRYLEEKLKEQLKIQELLKNKMEKILESKRRLQREFQDQLTRLEEERSNLTSKTERITELEADSISDLKSLQEKIRILEEKLSQTGQEKAETQEQFSKQIEELKEKQKNLKTELAEVVREKWGLEEKLEALGAAYQELESSKKTEEVQFKQTIDGLQANHNQLQEKLTNLLREKSVTNHQLKSQAEKLRTASKVLKQKLLHVNKLGQELQQRLNKSVDNQTGTQEELKAELSRLVEEKTQLRNQLKAVTDSKEQVEAELATLKSEFDSFQQARNESVTKFKELVEKYSQLGKVLKRLDQERKKLIQQLSAETAQKDQLKQELDKVRQAEKQLWTEIWTKAESEKKASLKTLEEELTKYQTEDKNLRKELADRMIELHAKSQEVDTLRIQLREHLKKEEDLVEKLNAIQAQHQQISAQMMEEKAQLVEKVCQLEAETDRIRELNAQQISQIKAELEEKSQKEKLLIGKLRQLVKAKALAEKSISEEAKKKLALYEKKISTLKTELEEVSTKNEQIRKELQNLENKYKKELASKQQEIEEFKKLKESDPVMLIDSMTQRFEKKLEDIQQTHKNLETFLKETRKLEETQTFQLKKGLDKVVDEIDRLEVSFNKKITSLEDRNLQTEAWLREVLDPQNLKTFIGQELDSNINHQNKSGRPRWLKGFRSGRKTILFILIVLAIFFFLRRVSYKEEFVLRLDHANKIDFQPFSELSILPESTSLGFSLIAFEDKRVPKSETSEEIQLIPYEPLQQNRDIVESDNKSEFTKQQSKKELKISQSPQKKEKNKSIPSKAGKKKVKSSSRQAQKSESAVKKQATAPSEEIVAPTHLTSHLPAAQPINSVTRFNQDLERPLWKDLPRNFYDSEEKRFRRPERPFRSRYLNTSVQYRNESYSLRRAFRSIRFNN